MRKLAKNIGNSKKEINETQPEEIQEVSCHLPILENQVAKNV